MTIDEIKKILKRSFKNGVYITNDVIPHNMGKFGIFELYLTVDGNVYDVQFSPDRSTSKVVSTVLNDNEIAYDKWEIIS